MIGTEIHQEIFEDILLDSSTRIPSNNISGSPSENTAGITLEIFQGFVQKLFQGFF